MINATQGRSGESEGDAYDTNVLRSEAFDLRGNSWLRASCVGGFFSSVNVAI